MSATDTVNAQIQDAVRQLNDLVPGADRAVASGVAHQVIALATGLALQNAVTRQQHSYVLRNALTTAVAHALLEGKKGEAEAVLKLAESSHLNRSLADDVTELTGALKAMGEELRKNFKAHASA
jgi:hypothetical protein